LLTSRLNIILALRIWRSWRSSCKELLKEENAIKQFLAFSYKNKMRNEYK